MINIYIGLFLILVKEEFSKKVIKNYINSFTQTRFPALLLKYKTFTLKVTVWKPSFVYAWEKFINIMHEIVTHN